MSQNYTPLGFGRIFRDPRTGEVVVDEDSIGRRGFQGEFAGFPFPGPAYGYEGDPEDDGPDYEGYGPVVYEAPAYSGPLYAGDEFYVDEFGALRRKNRHGRGGSRPPSRGAPSRHAAPPPRGHHPSSRQPQRQPAPRVVPATTRQEINVNDGPPEGMGMTALAGSQTLTDAGTATITIRAQHLFEATDVTFEGSSSGAKITGISFGPRTVLTAPDGISTSVFTPTSQMRKMLQGQRLDPGLDIVVTGTLTGAGSLNAVFFGLKPLGQG